jgi:8-oxo-dGTP pyrophosphatase MutT (NUDIX family)
MPKTTTSHAVPKSVLSVVEVALSLHKAVPMDGVGGVSVANAIAEGLVTPGLLEKMVRFFVSQEKPYQEAIQRQMTEMTDPLMRSWQLYGGDAGRIWSETRLRKAVNEEGYFVQDETHGLFKMRPEEVYESFSMSAWRWEYDLTPTKAARFVEEYQRATGFILDLKKAFGESATTVSRAVFRRAQTTNPFDDAIKAMGIHDQEFKMAATLDLKQMQTVEKGAIAEGLIKPAEFKKSPQAQTKTFWPVMVAYSILASEAPEYLVDTKGKRPPTPDETPQHINYYTDAVNTYLLYFHPEGWRYVDPSSDPKFSTLPGMVHTFMDRAWVGKPLKVQETKKLLNLMRRWTAENKLAGGIFQILLALWNKGAWAEILEKIPQECDVRVPFANFVAKNPLSKDALKLQQTLTDNKVLLEIESYFLGWPGVKNAEVSWTDIGETRVRLNTLDFAKVLAKKQTPIGVGSLVNLTDPSQGVSGEFVCLGAFTPVNAPFVVFRDIKTKKLYSRGAASLTHMVIEGNFVVTQAHYELKGSSYQTEPEHKDPVKVVADSPAEEHLWTDHQLTAIGDHLTAGKFDPNSYSGLLVQLAQKNQADEFSHPIWGQGFRKGRAHEFDSADTWSAKYPDTQPLQVGTQLRRTVDPTDWSSNGYDVEIIGFAIADKAGIDPDIAGAWEDSTWDLDKKLILLRILGTKNGGLSEITNTGLMKVMAVTDTGLEADIQSGNLMPIGAEVGKVKHEPAVTIPPEKASQEHEPEDFEPIDSSGFKGSSFRFKGRVSEYLDAQVLLGETKTQWVSSPLIVFDTSDTFLSGGKEVVIYETDKPTPDGSDFEDWMELGPDSGFGGLKNSLSNASDIYKDVFKHILPKPIREENHYTSFLDWSPGKSDTDLEVSQKWKVVFQGFASGQNFKVGTTGVRPICLEIDPSVPVGDASHVLGLRWVTVNGSNGGTYYVPIFGRVRLDSLTDAPKSSYTPPVLKPSSSTADEVIDPEQGNFEMSGTKLAFNYMKSVDEAKLTPTKTSGQFPIGLGAVIEAHNYGPPGPIRVIGFAVRFFPDHSTPAYIYDILLSTGEREIRWESVSQFSKMTGKPVGVDQDILNALLPTPEDKAKQKFPKLDYRLGQAAKKAHAKHGWIYTPLPTPKPPFGVGHHIALGETTHAANKQDAGWDTSKARILGYVADEHSGVNSKGEQLSDVVIRLKRPFGAYGDEEEIGYFRFPVDPTLNYSTVQYQHKAAVSGGDGESVFGQGAGDMKIAMTVGPYVGEPLTMPTTPTWPDDYHWDQVPAVKQPPFNELPVGHHVSAGVVCILPKPNLTGDNEAGDFAAMSRDAVLLFKPKGEYGGYKLSLPKGTVDKGESLEKAAVRETYEETGVLTKPVAYLGDFKTNTSITRMFIGYAIGGAPYTGPNSESDATVVYPFALRDYPNEGDTEPTYDKWVDQLKPDSGNTWQIEVMDKAFAWFKKNGLPSENPVETATDHAQVTHATDAVVEPGVPLSAEEWVNKGVFDKMMIDLPFPITMPIRVALEQKVADWFGTDVPVEISGQEGPEFGQVFVAKGYGDDPSKPTPYTFVGWVWVEKVRDEDEPENYRQYAIGVTDHAQAKVALIDVTDVGEGFLDFDSQIQPTPNAEAFYTHPEPDVNAVIQSIWAEGALSKAGLTLGKMRKFLKQMDFPHVKAIKTKTAASVASLFVPGAATLKQHDLIMLQLQALQGMGGDKFFTKMGAPEMLSTTIHSGGETTLQQVVKLNVDSPLYRKALLNPDPDKFTTTGQKAHGGSKPNQILDGPGGRYLFKSGNPGDPHGPAIGELEAAFSRMTDELKGNVIPVGVMTFNGVKGSVQAFAEDAQSPPSNPNDLTDENKAELLSQHAFDMFIGDHDGHAGNLLMVKGQLRAIDKGQGLRFLIEGAKESLDPTFHDSHRNLSGPAYAKTLLIAWGKDEATIPTSAFKAMQKTILKIKAQYNEGYLGGVLEAAFTEFGFSDAKKAELLATLVKKSQNYDKAWLKVLKKLRKDFKWPGGGTVSQNASLQHSPEQMGFTKEEETLVGEAVEAGWQGKAIRIDRNYLEGQEVMVKAAHYKGAPATLCFWRMTYEAGKVVDSNLLPVSEQIEVSDSGEIHTENRLSIDVENGYWGAIFKAIKSINYHLFSEAGDKTPENINKESVDAALAHRADLQKIYAETETATGPYKKTGLPSQNVYQMAGTYLNHIATIEFLYENRVEQLGKHSEIFHPYEVDFTAQEEQPETPEEKVVKLPFKCKYLGKRAVFPRTEGDSAEAGVPLIILNLNEVSFSESVPQYQLTDNAGARVFIIPTSEKVTTKGRRGHCWGFIAEPPSPASVAHIMRLFEEATKIEMKPSTKDDREAFYWMKQAHLLQTGGKVKPAKGEIADTTVEPETQAAQMTYRDGDSASAAEQAREFVAKKLGVSVAELEGLPGYEPEGVFNGGAGRRKQVRIGWDRKKLVATLGSGVTVCHNASAGKQVTVLDLLQKMKKTGPILLANEERPYGGVKPGSGSGSASADFSHGGSQGIFTCLRSKKITAPHHLCFDISLALRTDCYFVGTGDTYGDYVSQTKIMSPEAWAGMNTGATGTSAIGTSTPAQFNVRYDIDLREYLVKANCGGKRDACLAIVKEMGWVFKQGSPEEIFVA